MNDKNKVVLLGGAALLAYLFLRPQVIVVGGSYNVPGYEGYYDNGESEKLLSVNRR